MKKLQFQNENVRDISHAGFGRKTHELVGIFPTWNLETMLKYATVNEVHITFNITFLHYIKWSLP